MQSIGDMIVKQVDAIGDFLLEALVAAGERIGGAVAAGVQGMKDAGGRAMSAVKSGVDNSFSVGKPNVDKEPQLARSKQIEHAIEAPAIPEQAKAAVTSLGIRNSEIVASQMVDMPSGHAVSPAAVAVAVQTHAQGLGV